MASKRKHEYNKKNNNRALNREAWERSGAGSHGKFGKDENRADRRSIKQKIKQNDYWEE